MLYEVITIDAKVFSRRGVEKDDRTRWIEDSEIVFLEKERDDKLAVIQDVVRTKIEQLIVGQKSVSVLKKGKNVLIQKGDKIDSDKLAKIPTAQLEGIVLENPQLTEKVHDILERYRDQCQICRDIV